MAAYYHIASIFKYGGRESGFFGTHAEYDEINAETV
jgi:mRNA-degrading endonuclease HigB of HigAB toxin-antitoxin module